MWEKLKGLPISRSGDRAPRFPCQIGVMVHSEQRSHPIACTSVNLSRTGVLVEELADANTEWKIGELVQLELEPYPRYFAEPLRGKGKVARLVPEEKSTSGKLQIGIRFLS